MVVEYNVMNGILPFLFRLSQKNSPSDEPGTATATRAKLALTVPGQPCF